MEFEYTKYCDSIEGHLRTALGCKQFLESYAENLEGVREKIDGTHLARVSNLILNAIIQDYLLCTTKVWDKNKDTYSLPSIVANYNWKDIAGCTPQEAERRFKCPVNEFKESELMNSLRGTRAKGFAHALENPRDLDKMDDPKLACPKDIGKALDKAIDMWRQFQSIHGEDPTDFSRIESEIKPATDQFFKSFPNFNKGE